MGCLKICSILVPVLAVFGPLGMSRAFDGKYWDLFPAWDISSMPDLSGKVAIVTGPTVGGIGYESAVEMTAKGAQVILAGRSASKGKEAVEELLKRVPNAKVEFMKLDLGSMQSVKEFAAEFTAKSLPLHILMNNAGVMANPFTLTVDGLESQFGTNHIGHFLLTKLLLPHLEASAPSRVVTVSSAAAFIPEMLKMFEIGGIIDAAPAADFDKLGADYEEFPNKFSMHALAVRTSLPASYSPFKAYGRSKLANVLFTRALARRLEGKSVYANVCHPGGIHTNLARHVQADASIGEMANLLFSVLQQTVMFAAPRGAVTQLYLATSPEIESKDIRGQYYRPQALHETPPKFSTYELEEKLWSLSEKLVQEYL